MQIFNTAQLRAWDEYTIAKLPISSVDLMERAATACYEWLMNNKYDGKKFTIFCGKGNNGGDGLAIARMLSRSKHLVTVYILEFGNKGTDDFQVNLARLHETQAEIKFISTEESITHIIPGEIIIDALLGSGLNRTLQGLTAAVVQHINQSKKEIISIDIPSGLFTENSSKNNIVVEARHTLSFQCQKLAFMMEENEKYTGEVHILSIGLHPDFLKETHSAFNITSKEDIQSIIKPRKKFSQKGDYGHGALIAGSIGMMGAAVLSAKAFTRTGAGKLTCHIPKAGYEIMQISVPEAMCKIEGAEHILFVSELENYDTLGIGPGIGLYDTHAALLETIFKQYHKPVVIDADALNIIAKNISLLDAIPAHSVLTPHAREFERLFGKAANNFERIDIALAKAKQYNIHIVLKGSYTFIAMPSGSGYFNDTGNPGMATGGTGDALTGIISSLMAQGYEPEKAALAGVYLHGLAGDIAASVISEQSLIASDIINYLGNAFLQSA